MRRSEIKGTAQEKRLYDLIWKRTVACQMADAQLERTTVLIDVEGSEHHFVATGEVVKFEGFLRVYRESFEDNENESAENLAAEGLLPPMTEGQELHRQTITARQRYSLPPARYSEASLVHKLEELGIGRPSTYAPTISTIQQREYVRRGENEGKPRPVTLVTLTGKDIVTEQSSENYGSDRGKLVPTDTGIVVNDFLMEKFPEIMDYNFTANVEHDFDLVAEGEKDWTELIRTFYGDLEPQVETVLSERSDTRVGERHLGTDPATGKPVSVKIGRFGPMVQIGGGEGDDKPRFARQAPDQSIATITLEEALELCKLPRELGTFEDLPVTVGAGRFGPYVQHDRKYVSIPKDEDPLTITLERGIELILAKRETDAKRHLLAFEAEPELEVLNGRYGPYIKYKGKNYKIPKDRAEHAAELTLEECRALIEAGTKSTTKKAAKATTRRRTTKKSSK